MAMEANKPDYRGNVLVSYDVSDEHARIKQMLTVEEIGFKDTVKGDDGRTYYLPETTLWRPDSTLVFPLDALRACIEVINKDREPNEKKVVLKRCIVSPANEWWGLVGTPIGS